MWTGNGTSLEPFVAFRGELLTTSLPAITGDASQLAGTVTVAALPKLSASLNATLKIEPVAGSYVVGSPDTATVAIADPDPEIAVDDGNTQLTTSARWA